MSPALSRRSLLAAAGAGAAATTLTAPQAAATPYDKRRSAALVIRDARVFTGRPGAAPQEAVAVGRDGTVLAVGRSADLRRWVGRDTEVVDAGGDTVMSGLVDAHAHPMGAAARTLQLSLNGAKFTVPELQEALKKLLADSASAEPDGWLSVAGWNSAGLLPAGTEPHHRMLDSLPTRRPIVLQAGDGHNSWVNQRALDLAGITATTPNPPAGEIVRDAGGAATGLLKDRAQDLVRVLIPGPAQADLVAAGARILSQAAAAGITTFLDASATSSQLDTYAGLAAQGKLLQRVTPALRLSVDQVKDPKGALAYLRGLRDKYKGVPGLRFGTAKVFLDGVIEYPAQTAALLTPYLDKNGKPTTDYGDLYVTAAEYGNLAAVLDRADWQLHAHAIGDRAVRTALDGYAAAKRANGQRGNRHTIAHLQLVDPADYRRFAALGVVACMQLQWAMRDEWTMDALLPYIGPERHRRLYPARSLQQHGALLAGGSDWPVDPLQPWNQIRTAIDREGAAAEQGALYPELQSIGRTAALRMHTAASAYQLHMEHRIGTLAPGRAADLVLLDRDITRVPVREISDIQVRLTLVNGRVVHDAQSPAAGVTSSTASAAARPAQLADVHVDRHEACGCGHPQASV
ncbi:amidohydrolase [Streptomyces sp. MBT62]|uniref:amidohydrolase n=1 Tax=Streptomyces sp. MBT62 TaxID=2800410 RepID=UPI00190B0FB4|nr:amidohydrolase [Streptomyces sp. MBT62]MBK3569483.1 amidohydrolase [Streptomyces sp. MBT62]